MITQKWSEISGKKVNIVMTNNTVLFVTLDALHKNQLMIKNMRLKQQTLNIDEISEIILDY